VKIVRNSGLWLVLAGTLFACSAPKKASPEGVAELRKMLSAVQDVEIVVSAGATEDQYSQRLTDALLKFGKLDEVCKHALTHFAEPAQQNLSAQICQHLGTALDAYTYAKGYFGPEYNLGFDISPTYNLNDADYARVRERFPMLEDLPIADTGTEGHKFYARSMMLQALWKVAGHESQAAKDLIEKLAQMGA